MSDFRDYEVIQTLRDDFRCNNVTAHKPGSKRVFFLKALRLDSMSSSHSSLEDTRILRYAELQSDPRLHYQEAIKAQGAAGRVKNSNVAPIYDCFPTEEGICYATDYYQNGSLKQRIKLSVPHHPTLQNVIGGILRGLSSLKSASHRGHGNLHTENVMLGGDRRTPLRVCRIFLTDVAPASSKTPAELELDDLRSVGQIIYQVVMRKVEDRKEDIPFPVRSTSEWDQLGDKGAFWLKLCNRLLDPDLVSDEGTIEGLIAEIGRPASRGLLIGMAASVLVVVAAGAGIWWYTTRPKILVSLPPPSVVFTSTNPPGATVVAGGTMTWTFRVDNASNNAPNATATPSSPNLKPTIVKEGGEYTMSVTIPPSVQGPARIDFTAGGAATNISFSVVPPTAVIPPSVVFTSTNPPGATVVAGGTMTWTFRVDNASNNAPNATATPSSSDLKPTIVKEGGEYTMSVTIPPSVQGPARIDFTAGGAATNISFSVVPPTAVIPPSVVFTSTNPPGATVVAGGTMTWTFRVDNASNNAPNATATPSSPNLKPTIIKEGGEYTMSVTIPPSVQGPARIDFTAGGAATNISFSVVPPTAVIPPSVVFTSTNPPGATVVAGGTMTWTFRVDNASNNAPNATATPSSPNLKPTIVKEGGEYTMSVTIPPSVQGPARIDFTAGGAATNISFSVVPPTAVIPPSVVFTSTNPPGATVVADSTKIWTFRVDNASNNAPNATATPSSSDLKPTIIKEGGEYTMSVTIPPSFQGPARIDFTAGGATTNISFSVLPLPTVSLENQPPLVLHADDTSIQLRFTLHDESMSPEKLDFSLEPSPAGILNQGNPVVDGATRLVTLTRRPGMNRTVRLQATVKAGDRVNNLSLSLEVEAPRQPALTLFGPTNFVLDVNAKHEDEVVRIPCRAVDAEQVHFEIVPPSSSLLQTSLVKFERSEQPDNPTNGFIVLTPKRGFVGTVHVNISTNVAGATSTNYALELIVRGDIHGPRILNLSANPITLEQDQKTNIPVKVEDDYFSPTELNLFSFPYPENIVSAKVDPATGILTVAGQAPGQTTIALSLIAPNGTTNTIDLPVTVSPAQPPSIDISPASPISFSKDAPVNIRISDNVTPVGEIQVAFRDLSGPSSAPNWKTNTSVVGTNILLALSLGNPPAQDATNQTFEITATDLAGHLATKLLEFVFRIAPKLYTNASTGMVLRWVPGLPETTGGAYVGQFEVTQGQFQTVLGTNPSAQKGDTNYPVESVTLKQATDFCDKLNDLDKDKPPGSHYSLPSDQQWRFLANGTPRDTNNANFILSGIRHPIKVGSLAANPFGLYDILGNVCEWTTTKAGPFQIYKGGSFRGSESAFDLNLSKGIVPDKSQDDIGFRVILVPASEH